jgi:preprotein translocase subunit YajC
MNELQIGDWVRTTKGKIGKIVFIDEKTGTASLESLDDDRKWVSNVIYPLAQLTKIEIKQ